MKSQHRINWKRLKLTREEKEIEAAINRGEYRSVGPLELARFKKSLAHHRKEAVISLRVNKQDLEKLKKKSQRLGIGYQTLLAEVIPHLAA